MSLTANPDKVDKLASQCVKCALCLPYCPTYQITEDENESPRGRIALFQALSQKKLPLTDKVQLHLDQCLGCRACEAVCPAHVQYGELLVTGRANWHHSSPFYIRLLENRSFRKILHHGLWWLEKFRLRSLARKLKLISLLRLSAWDALLPPITRPQSLSEHYPALSEKRGSVMLFLGCISPWCDQKTLLASIYVLRKWGYDVLIPPNQTCCGAMALHSGYPLQATHLNQRNHQAFSSPLDHIVTFATGCSSTLQEKDPRFIDIMDFLNLQGRPSHLNFKPLPWRVKLHTPCTRRYVLKTTATPENVLNWIPQLEISTFSSASCCGAAGTYMLEHPNMAATLADKLLAELATPLPNYIASTNIGCALHLRRELNQRNLAIKVEHPVMLLARALDFNDPCYPV